MGAACRAVLERNVCRRGCVLATYHHKDDSRSRLKYPVLRSARRHVGRGATPFIKDLRPSFCGRGAPLAPAARLAAQPLGELTSAGIRWDFPRHVAVEFKLIAMAAASGTSRHRGMLRHCRHAYFG